jgi:hypothetical protein
MKHLEFKDKYKELLKSGKKTATIRVQCYVKKGDEVFVHCGGRIIGTAKIIDVEEKSLDELSDEDAKADGFSSKEELLEEIKKLYGNPKKVYLIRFKFKAFKNEIDPHEMYYSDADLVEIAKKALEHLSLSEKDKKILQLFVKTGSIRKTAMKLGGLKKRGVIRKILRSCYDELRRRGFI